MYVVRIYGPPEYAEQREQLLEEHEFTRYSEARDCEAELVASPGYGVVTFSEE